LKFRLRPAFFSFRRSIAQDSFLANFDTELQGDSTTSPVEDFTHYDSFYFWLFSSLGFESKNLRILDLGGKKMANGILSLRSRVTSMNLAIPIDGITSVRYVLADATKPLPFDDNSFDVFISPVSLNLIGLGRYGDSIDARAIPHLISELKRVTTNNSVLYISIVYGESKVYFNTHIKFRFRDIEEMFKVWRIEDYLIDIGQPRFDLGLPRFTKDVSEVEKKLARNENVIFLELKRFD